MPLLFTGYYDLKIDAKNRLFIPADYRKGIEREQQGTAFFLIPGLNRMPWLYPEKMYETVLNRIPLLMSPGEPLRRLMHLKFTAAEKIAWDEQGRLVLPDKALKKAGIDKEISLLGVGDHLELWNRAAWEKEHDDVVTNAPEIEETWTAMSEAKAVNDATKKSA
jgi:MraZ protein